VRGSNSLLEKRVYQFGEFRLDTAERVLTRAGCSVSLAPKALDVLIALVENRGHIVEKEELMRQVWPGIFVEENSLAFNISVLRKALGESSASPRYIETVPKRGYRFIADVDVMDVSATETPSAPVIAKQSGNGVSRAPRTAVRPLLAVAVVLGVAAIAFLTFLLRPRQTLTARDTIVLADFVNQTGDPVFDGTLRQGMAIQLEQSPFVSLVSEERIRHTLRLMNQSPDASLSPALARQVCERTGSAAVVEGSIASLGSSYVLALQAKMCGTGESLDNQQAQVRRKEDVLDALSRMARRFRSRIGESLPSLRQRDMPLIEVTTPSLEALKAYSASIRAGYAHGCAASVPFAKLAVELDPQFAMAHSHLGRCYANLGESVLAAESIRKAYELRKRASDREQFYITVNYQRQVPGNLQKAREAAELWAQTYPRDATSHGTLGGTIDQGLGRYAEAIEEAQKAITLDPDMAPGYVALGFADLYVERPADAARAVQRATERNLSTPDLLLLGFYNAFLRNDKPGMERAAAGGRGRAGAEDAICHSRALWLARSGQLRLAREISRRAIELALEADQRQRAATYESAAAIWEAFLGNASAARQKATEALSRSVGRDVEYSAAFALALAGDCARSQVLAVDLEKRFPEDTFVRINYLPALRGLLVLKSREPARAIAQLETAVPAELAVPGISIFAFFGALYPAYVRGEAFMALHQGLQAAAEFRKFLDHPGIVLADPAGAIARLELARALVMSGDDTKAATAYEDFLALWNDADPDIPLLKQARSEYRKLLENSRRRTDLELNSNENGREKSR
jgi:eukaryotic-like serine/threonine-protein kinase